VWWLVFVVTADGCHFIDETMCCCAESTGHYLLIALLLSTVTFLSQASFQLYGFIAEPNNSSALAPCEMLLIFKAYTLCIWLV